MADAAPADADASETVTYQFEMDREEWDQWTDTFPRSHAIDKRLRTLIKHDLRSATRDSDGDGSIEGKTLSVFATRIRIRAMQAMGAVREDDTEKAIGQLEEISDMADVLEG